MSALPDGWEVFDGSPDPPPPVDQNLLRSAWACVKGERMPEKKQIGNPSGQFRAAEYAHLKNALTEINKLRTSGADGVSAWYSWKRKHESLTDKNGLTSAAYDWADQVRETKRLLRAFVDALAAEMGISREGSSRSPQTRKRSRVTKKK